MRSVPLLPVLLLCACSGPQPDPIPTSSEATVAIDTTASSTAEGDALTLEDGTVLRTGLHEAQLLGTVKGFDGKAHLVMSGRYCAECDAEVALYVHAPADGPLVTGNGMNARMYPGVARDGETGEPYYEARAFFGDVLEGVPGVIWYVRALEPDGSMQEHTMLLNLTAGQEDSQQPGRTLLEKTLKQVDMGKCQEIPGIDRTSAP